MGGSSADKLGRDREDAHSGCLLMIVTDLEIGFMIMLSTA
jgi:hypothetical protein